MFYSIRQKRTRGNRRYTLYAMNFFVHETAAQRYAKSRPYFHPLVMEKIKKCLSLTEPVASALDVGCGTGQSTVALKTLAHSVIGVDASASMIESAQVAPNISYVVAPAESIPLADAAFDLATVSLAFHWFDRAAFLHEAHRLLKPNGHLAIYNNGFYGMMRENSAFAQWNEAVYLARYPSPPRHHAPLTDENFATYGFRFLYRERYENDVSFTPATLAAYLTTQSNIIAHVEQGTETIEVVYEWLLNQVTPFFQASEGTFQFGGSFWLLKRVNLE